MSFSPEPGSLPSRWLSHDIWREKRLAGEDTTDSTVTIAADPRYFTDGLRRAVSSLIPFH